MASKFFVADALFRSHTGRRPTAFHRLAPHGSRAFTCGASASALQGVECVHGGGAIRMKRILNLARFSLLERNVRQFDARRRRNPAEAHVNGVIQLSYCQNPTDRLGLHGRNPSRAWFSLRDLQIGSRAGACHVIGAGQAKINLLGPGGAPAVGINRGDLRRLIAETIELRGVFLQEWKRIHG
jgi:hypothetical protein